MDEEEYSSERPTPAAHHGQGNRHGHRPASTSELMASAKVVAGAAQSAFTSHSAAGIDKARVSEAAEDLLDAAKKYGKLEGGSGFGSYLDKAEDYLHNLHSSSSTTSPPSSAHAPAPHGRQEHSPARYEEEEEESRPGGGGGGGGGVGDYLKMAQGFLK